MKESTLAALTGLLLCCMGLTTMVSWSLHMPTLVSFPFDNTFAKFNTALEFFLVGLCLWVMNSFSKYKMIKPFSIMTGAIVFLIALLTLSQSVFDYSLRVHEIFANANWQGLVKGENSSAVSFTLAGIFLMVFPLNKNKKIAALLIMDVFLILMMGITSLIMQAFFTLNNTMSFITTLGMITLSFSLLLMLKNSRSIEPISSVIEDKKILMLSATIVLCFLLLGGLIFTALVTSPNTDTETFKHLTERGFLITLLAIIFGMFLLYWQILPLIKSVINTKAQLSKANQRLTESENKFRSAFDFAAVGMALVSLGGRCIKVNQALCNMLGYKDNELLNNDMRIYRHSEDVKKDVDHIQKMIDGEIKIYQSEQRFYHKNGDVIWVMVSMSIVSSAIGKPLYFIYQCQNMSAEKKAEEQLRQMAYHDPLTGLANRNKLEQGLHQHILSSQRTQMSFALIFLDLDNFKNINDTIGHDAGDILLQVIAERLKNTVRTTDIVARLGGDEFVLVIDNVKKVEVVVLIAQKILHQLLKPVMIKGHEIYVTTSMGISFYPHDGLDIQTLMKSADMALYRAKEQGRNNYQFCTPEMTAKAEEKMIRQNALSHAMVKDEFYLLYQPKMDLITKRISGVEALLRWKKNEGGKITTEEIISLAEESGLIVSLSEWILRTACKQVKAWNDAGLSPLSLAINLSPRQFKQVDFTENVLKVLAELNFPPQNIELEITESLIMQDPENTLKVLKQLKEANIHLAIDDFGTGYSSLSYLKRFAVDKIKIDKTFMHKINDETNVAIISAMIAMAHKLGIKTLAEGIETQHQVEFLIKEKCSEMQGYYLSRPLSVFDMTEYLQKNIHTVNLPQKIT